MDNIEQLLTEINRKLNLIPVILRHFDSLNEDVVDVIHNYLESKDRLL